MSALVFTKEGLGNNKTIFVLSFQEREMKRMQLVMNKAHEKEKRKQELIMMKAYEAQRRAEVTNLFTFANLIYIYCNAQGKLIG